MDSNGQADLKRNGRSSRMTTQAKSSPHTGPMSSDTGTSETLFDLNPSTLSAGDSHAKTFPWPVREPASQESDQLFGGKCVGSFAKLSPDGSWLKMYQGYSQATLDGSSEISSETWPQRATMRNGECYRRREWERRTSDDESLSLAARFPTPKASESKGGWSSRGGGLSLGAMAKHNLWPTPNTGSRGAGKKRAGHAFNLQDAVGSGSLNPTWVEWLMGFPQGWTDLNASATPSFRKSRRKSAK